LPIESPFSRLSEYYRRKALAELRIREVDMVLSISKSTLIVATISAVAAIIAAVVTILALYE
jgi:hypothetical protein